MVNIESSIGKSNLRNPGQKWSVDDKKQINPYEVAALRQQVQEQDFQAEFQQTQEARKRIEIITGLGRKTKDVEIVYNNSKVIITLRSLKSFENNYLSELYEKSETVMLSNGKSSLTSTSLYTLKVEALAHSLYFIDGKSIDIILGTVNEDYDVQLTARRQLVSEMDNTLTDYLFNKYDELRKETIDGYMPKSLEEAKEVVDTIRKSGQNT